MTKAQEYQHKYYVTHRKEILDKCSSRYATNPDKYKTKSHDYYLQHIEEYRTRGLAWKHAHPDRNAGFSRDVRTRNREAVLEHYGNQCVCCGETETLFLEIDHINNNGSVHRKEMKAEGTKDLYTWLKKHNYPSGFQTLCSNCNQGKRRNHGICPHQGK